VFLSSKFGMVVGAVEIIVGVVDVWLMFFVWFNFVDIETGGKKTKVCVQWRERC